MFPGSTPPAGTGQCQSPAWSLIFSQELSWLRQEREPESLNDREPVPLELEEECESDGVMDVSCIGGIRGCGPILNKSR